MPTVRCRCLTSAKSRGKSWYLATTMIRHWRGDIAQRNAAVLSAVFSRSSCRLRSLADRRVGARWLYSSPTRGASSASRAPVPIDCYAHSAAPSSAKRRGWRSFRPRNCSHSCNIASLVPACLGLPLPARTSTCESVFKLSLIVTCPCPAADNAKLTAYPS